MIDHENPYNLRGCPEKTQSELIPIHWPREKGRSSLRVPRGLKESIDDFLSYLGEEAGILVSRNDFVFRAILHFFLHVSEAASAHDLLKKLGFDKVEIERALGRKALLEEINKP